MFKSYKYRIYPTSKQKELIEKHIGCCRFIYNLALETKQLAYSGNKIKLSAFDLINQLPDLKDQCVWLKEVNAQSLTTTINHMGMSYSRFFKKQSGFPAFKRKKEYGSFSIPQSFRIKDNRLIIPKFKEGIEIILHRPITGIIKQCTISKTASGKYFASILCDTGEPMLPKPQIKNKTTIGVDLGIKSFLVTSDGEVVDNPKYLHKAQSKLKYLQRKYSKHKGKRTKQRLALAHEKVANQRRDFLQKTSTKLIRESQTICLEDLNIHGMIKNHHLAGAISDAGWGMFVSMLEYKAEWYGKNILKIGRFEPSSKTCSHCGNINQELTLKDRSWTCSECGTVHDRDENAAINIKNFALKNLSVERRLKSQRELPTLAGAMISETHLE